MIKRILKSRQRRKPPSPVEHPQTPPPAGKPENVNPPPASGATMKDIYWVALRQVLMIAGSALGMKYGLDAAAVGKVIDLVLAATTASAAAGAALWGLYVRFGTRAVSERTASRIDVPTVSPVTGAVEH